MRIPLTKYGWRELLLMTAVCAVLAAASAVVFWPAAVLPVAAWLFVVQFFRDPERRPAEEGALLSPADGTVADITPVGADGPLGRPGTRVGIFMSVVSVHVNRSPCACTVRKVEHHDGGFVDARRPEASEVNESATIWLELPGREAPRTIVLRQIAGLIARRIVTDLRPGQALSAGERIGMIKFGSRCELLVPQELVGEVAVRLGQRVYGGRTVLVRPPAAANGPFGGGGLGAGDERSPAGQQG